MEFCGALIIPGLLTLLVIVLSWLYKKDVGRMVSEWLVSNSNAKKAGAEVYSNPVKKEDEVIKEDEKPTQENDDVLDDDVNLRAEIQPYLIDPEEIQSVAEQVPLDNKLIEQEMKEQGMENIQTYFKTSRLHIKEMEGLLSRQEREQERMAQRKQLEEIYHLMAQEKEKFGVDSMDEIEDQMRLYNTQ